MEISNLPDEAFKIMVMKMLIELWRRINDEQNKNFNKKIENIRVPNRYHKAEEYNK